MLPFSAVDHLVHQAVYYGVADSLHNTNSSFRLVDIEARVRNPVMEVTGEMARILALHVDDDLQWWNDVA